VIPAAVLALLGLGAELLPAQGYDPRFAWATVETAHFRVHYHQGLGPLAQRTARACERAWAALVPLVARAPGQTIHVVLSDDVDDANGSATAQPRDLIRLYGVAPLSGSELSDHGDWLELVVTHELTHVVHLDAVGGLPAIVNGLFGKVLAPAGLGPPWLTEGLAVLHESGPGAGRNESSLFSAWARGLALGDRLPRLDQVSSVPLEWPGGNLWYLLGGRFLAFLQERAGPAALRAFAEEQGEQLWPYLMNTLAERHFGQSFDALWAEFGEGLRARARAEVEAAAARPLTPGAQLTRRGGTLLGPRFAPDGRSLWVLETSLDEPRALRRVHLDGRELSGPVRVEGNGSFALVDDGHALVAITDAFEEYRSVDDLYLVDLDSGARRRLTFGERATDPDVAPGGGWAVYVARLPGGEQELRRIRLEGGPPETVFQRPGAQLFLPRIAPDGKRIALEVQERGRRDIAVWEGNGLRFVTDDDAIDQAPAWAPDGQALYFSSDRGGIPNVHRFRFGVSDGVTGCCFPRPLVPGEQRQVTNVTGAALQPAIAPDAGHLAWLALDAKGYQLVVAPLDPDAVLFPQDPGTRRAHRQPAPPEEPALPSRDYSAWETIGPTWWFPTLSSDASGTTLGAITAGGDVVGRHAWGFDLAYGLGSREPSYSVAYAGGFMHPLPSLASARSFGLAPDGRDEVAWIPLDVSLGWSRTHLDRAHAITVGWRSILLRPQGAPDLADPAPYRGGTASELSLGVAYGSRLRFVRSISAEEGGLLSLRVRAAAPDLGGDQRYATARLSAAGYLRLPGTRHVVLALHGSLGGSSGQLAGRQPFSLGGVATADLLGLVQGLAGGGFPSQADQLRGYPTGAFSGPTLVSTSAELRFPLFSTLRGYSTWPLFLRRLHGALFVDAGAVFGARDGAMGRRLGSADLLRFGAGGELRLEVVLAYYLRTDLRLGVARGLGPLLAASPRPADPLATTQVYLGLGESF